MVRGLGGSAPIQKGGGGCRSKLDYCTVNLFPRQLYIYIHNIIANTDVNSYQNISHYGTRKISSMASDTIFKMNCSVAAEVAGFFSLGEAPSYFLNSIVACICSTYKV